MLFQKFQFLLSTSDKKQLEKAVKECIEKGILADYLFRKSSEVTNMLLDEYSYETDIEVQREEAAEEAAEKATKESLLKFRGTGSLTHL